jgi:ferrochelatase
VLLVNLGTPDAPRPPEVRRYLREFLGDPRVIDLPAPLRRLLLEAVILPFRPRRSAEAYAKIWTDAGSPLLVHGRALTEALGKTLGSAFRVELGMRYGRPTLGDALDALRGTDSIVVVPLYPQYASSSTGSTLERVFGLAARRADLPPLSGLAPFFTDVGFVRALASVTRPLLGEHLLLSYHGLPERQARRGGPDCLQRPDCCDGPPGPACYRAQCFATSRALAAELGLDTSRHSTCFQSRLGRAAWIGPSLEERLDALRGEGVARLSVVCPSFVADCLETLEEIGIRARETWRGLGGDELTLVPCLNARPEWVDALAALVRTA